jgi:hypothetical protein
MKMTVATAISAYEFDIEMLRADKKNSNRTKLIQRDALMLQFLRTMPADLVLGCEGTPYDNEKPNAGSLAEIALRYHFANNEEVRAMEKSGGDADMRYKNGRGIEIKLSVNGSCYNTPVREIMTVYLINRDGVYIVPKTALEAMLEDSKKLPQTADKALEYEGVKLHKTLTKALGFTL